MIPKEMFAEDLLNAVIRFGLYIGAAFQIVCLLACVTLTEEQCEPITYDKQLFSDSDEYSSEQSSPGHRASLCRARRHEKKKRR